MLLKTILLFVDLLIGALIFGLFSLCLTVWYYLRTNSIPRKKRSKWMMWLMMLPMLYASSLLQVTSILLRIIGDVDVTRFIKKPKRQRSKTSNSNYGDAAEVEGVGDDDEVAGDHGERGRNRVQLP